MSLNVPHLSHEIGPLGEAYDICSASMMIRCRVLYASSFSMAQTSHLPYRASVMLLLLVPMINARYCNDWLATYGGNAGLLRRGFVKRSIGQPRGVGSDPLRL
jgi:hypothetical protein